MRTPSKTLSRAVRWANRIVLACVAVFAIVRFGATHPQDDAGTLRLTIVEGEPPKPVPARVQILGDKGEAHVAPDAVPIGGD